MKKKIRIRSEAEFRVLYARWQKERPIVEQMPLQFPAGASMHEFNGKCLSCGRNIRADLLRGTVVFPMPSVAVLDALGACYDCRLLTPFFCRVRGEEGLVLEWIHDELGWIRTKGEYPVLSKLILLGEDALRLLTFGRFPPGS